MDWQQVVSLAMVALAGVLLVRGKLRKRKHRFDPVTGCGCPSPSKEKVQGSIVFRARKGARSEVIVKMK